MHLNYLEELLLLQLWSGCHTPRTTLLGRGSANSNVSRNHLEILFKRSF